MRNFLLIARDDLRSLVRNVICAIVALGLVLVPPMYAWMTTLGFWDPYANTGGITVAVADEDVGYTSDLVPTKIDAGEQIVSQLRANDQFHWVFVSKDEAVQGVESGAYYAALVIPESFTSDLMSVFSDHTTKAHIEYYSNEKENAIAPHVTAQGATELQTQIDEAFSTTVANIALGVSDDMTEYLSGAGIQDYAQQLLKQLNGTIDELRDAQAQAQAFGVLVSSTGELVDATGNVLGSVADSSSTTSELLGQTDAGLSDVAGSMQQNTSLVSDALAQTQTRLEQLDGQLKGIDPQLQADVHAAADQLTSVRGEYEQKLQDGITQMGSKLESVAGESEQIAHQLQDSAASLAATSDSLAQNLAAVDDSLAHTAEVLGSAADGLSTTRDKLQAALDSNDLDEVRTMIGSNPAALASFLSAPTQLVEHPVYQMDDNGSSMSAFYTSLSLWIGAVFLIALTSVNVPKRRLEQLHDPTPAQLYLGRYVVFALIAIAQAVVVCVGNVFFVGVQCEHFGLYLLAGVVCAIVFSNLAYTLAVSFGNIGKAIVIIGLVMQLAGAGGIFPVQLSAPIFQDIYPWLPFAHSMNAFNGCIAGIYGDQYWVSLACLAAFLVPSLLLGLVLRRPVIRLNDYVLRKLDETQVL